MIARNSDCAETAMEIGFSFSSREKRQFINSEAPIKRDCNPNGAVKFVKLTRSGGKRKKLIYDNAALGLGLSRDSEVRSLGAQSL